MQDQKALTHCNRADMAPVGADAGGVALIVALGYVLPGHFTFWQTNRNFKKWLPNEINRNRLSSPSKIAILCAFTSALSFGIKIARVVKLVTQGT